jgi:hypothetical protein
LLDIFRIQHAVLLNFRSSVQFAFELSNLEIRKYLFSGDRLVEELNTVVSPRSGTVTGSIHTLPPNRLVVAKPYHAYYTSRPSSKELNIELWSSVLSLSPSLTGKDPFICRLTDLYFEKPPLTVFLHLQPPEDLQVAEVELEDAGVEPIFEALLLILSQPGLLPSFFKFFYL